MNKIIIHNLTPFHYAQVIERAKLWRRANHSLIIQLIKDHPRSEAHLKPKEPEGAIIFDPIRWEAAHWLWFSECIINIMGRNLKQH